MPLKATPGWTIAGLIIALFGLPAIIIGFRTLVDMPNDATIVFRESAIFALAGNLLWIVMRREQRKLGSIGLCFDRPGRSVIWGLLLAAALFGLIVAVLAGFSVVGVPYGGDSAIAPSLAVVLLTVLRAGVCEELFYRGFAIERLEEMARSKWVAAGASLVVFAGFHYRQGAAGMVLALVLGAGLTAFYLWKRDLLAAIIAHFLVDFIPNVLLPLLSGRMS